MTFKTKEEQHTYLKLISNDRTTILSDLIEEPKSFKLNLVDNYIEYKGEHNTNINVTNDCCITTAYEYSNTKVLLLNMASYRRPGGGVVNGKISQEEDICRRTNLFKSINRYIDNYPLKKQEYLYTKDVSIFLDNTYNLIDSKKVDIISIPALNINKEIDSNLYNKLTFQKIYNIYNIAKDNNIETLVLSAFGCGVFKNNPHIIANFFKNILNQYFDGIFKNVIFAILNDHNSVDNNYIIFKEIFNI